MGILPDLDAMKAVAAKEAEREKRAVMDYMHRYSDALYSALTGKETAEACNAILNEACNDPRVSPQSFVALCVWAFA